MIAAVDEKAAEDLQWGISREADGRDADASQVTVCETLGFRLPGVELRCKVRSEAPRFQRKVWARDVILRISRV